MSESLTREGILHNYEPEDTIQDPSQNIKFVLYVIDNEYYREDTYEQSNPPSNNEVINKLDNLRMNRWKV